MQPATIRRLLVFGVCLVAVGCLYLVPSMAGSTDRVGGTSTGPRDTRTTAPSLATGELATGDSRVNASTGTSTSSGTPGSTARTTTHTSPGSTDPGSADPGSTDPGNAADPTEPGDPTDPHGDLSQPATTHAVAAEKTHSGASAVNPSTDQIPPTAVGRLWVTRSDPERLGIGWEAAADDQGPVWYEVSVNGFTVTTTQQTETTVAWFNDSSTHVVQVRAVDQADNIGPWSPTLMVTRPNPSPTPEPTRTVKSAPRVGTDTSATPTEGGSPKEDNS